MSVAQLKDQLSELSEDDLLEVAFFVQELLDKGNPERLAKIARQMDEGKYLDQDEVLAIHNKLISEGR